VNFVIHFNLNRGFEDEALLLARRLFATFDTAIDSLALIPVVDEDLDLVFDDQLIGSLTRDGRAPRLADVKAVLEAVNE
jgi:predicted Rdx family selenoprotein